MYTMKIIREGKEVIPVSSQLSHTKTEKNAEDKLPDRRQKMNDQLCLTCVKNSTEAEKGIGVREKKKNNQLLSCFRFVFASCRFLVLLLQAIDVGF